MNSICCLTWTRARYVCLAVGRVRPRSAPRRTTCPQMAVSRCSTLGLTASAPPTHWGGRSHQEMGSPGLQLSTCGHRTSTPGGIGQRTRSRSSNRTLLTSPRAARRAHPRSTLRASAACMLHVARCVLHASCYMAMSHVACCVPQGSWSFLTGAPTHGPCCVLRRVCRMLRVACCVLHVACCSGRARTSTPARTSQDGGKLEKTTPPSCGTYKPRWPRRGKC